MKQPEAYRHDYSVVEQRINQLEAPAYRQRLIGRGLFAAGVLAGLGLLALMIAVSWRIANPTAAVTRLDLPDISTAPVTTPSGAKIVTNFTLFRETEVAVGGQSFEVVAGHRYGSTVDDTYRQGWCYTTGVVGGVTINLSLAAKLPGAAAAARAPSRDELDLLKLTEADVDGLAAGCPWIDARRAQRPVAAPG